MVQNSHSVVAERRDGAFVGSKHDVLERVVDGCAIRRQLLLQTLGNGHKVWAGSAPVGGHAAQGVACCCTSARRALGCGRLSGNSVWIFE